jgi:hypothetical protein
MSIMKNKKKKQVPQTLFGTMAKKYPSAHFFCVALNMVNIKVDIETAELIERVLKKVGEVGGKFDIGMAVDLRLDYEDEIQAVKEQFNSNKDGE